MPLSLEDRLDIIDRMSRYGYMMDERAWGRLGDVFAPDIVYDFKGARGGVLRGIEALRERWTESFTDDYPVVGHHVTNIVIGDDDGGRVPVQSMGVIVLHDGTTSTADYHDVFVRTEAGWRIASRTLSMRRRRKP